MIFHSADDLAALLMTCSTSSAARHSESDQKCDCAVCRAKAAKSVRVLPDKHFKLPTRVAVSGVRPSVTKSEVRSVLEEAGEIFDFQHRGDVVFAHYARPEEALKAFELFDKRVHPLLGALEVTRETAPNCNWRELFIGK